MISRRHRAISLLLATSLLMTSTQGVASDWFDGYQTGATPRKWTDGGGGKYFYGGDITYRFKRTTAFKPIFDARPPGIKAGCNGISVSGGFIHFLGLDEIKEQLQSAGQGAMMGVVVGIVYSLPGIADAFDKVQKYVRLLQQILSQSCQMTSQLTKQWIDQQRKDANNDKDKLGYENMVGEVFNGLSSDISYYSNSLNKGIEYLEKKLEDDPKASTNAKNIPAVKASLICNATCKAAKIDSTESIKNYVQASDPSDVYKEAHISDIGTLMTNEERRRHLEFSIVFVGYYSVDAFPMGQTKEEYAKEMAQQINTGGKMSPKARYHRGLFFSGNNINGDKMVKELLYGPDLGATSLQLPNVKIFPFYLESKDASNTVVDIQSGILFGSKDTASSATGYTYPWKGFVRSGEDYLRQVIIVGDNTAVPDIPSVFPGMQKYVNVLKTQYRKNNNIAYVNSLITLLAKKNAVMLLQSIVSEMQSTLSESMTQEDQKQYQIAIDSIHEELERINAYDSSIADTIKIFEKIEQSHTVDITGFSKDQ